jgi:hypothetical protein
MVFEVEKYFIGPPGTSGFRFERGVQEPIAGFSFRDGLSVGRAPWYPGLSMER